MSEKEFGEVLDSSLESSALDESIRSSRGATSRLKFFSIAKYNTQVMRLVAGVVGVFVVIALGSFLFVKPSATESPVASNTRVNIYPVGKIPVTGLSASALQMGQAEKLTINGQLIANDGIVLTPSAAPEAGVPGQLYFDQTTNKPYFYNGAAFVPIAQETAAPVQSIGGATGVVGLGNGLRVVNGQIQLADNILQAATVAGATTAQVTAVQGQTGAVSFSGGNGIAINGTTFTNTGLLSIGNATGNLGLGRGLAVQGGAMVSTIKVASGSANLVISGDADGNYVITDTSSSGSSAQIALGPNVAQSDITGNISINIDKASAGDFLRLASNGVDQFVVNQTGVITTGTIAYSQVTGRPATTVTSLGGADGAISLGSGITIASNVLSSSGVLSLTGTTDQVNVNASTGAIILSLPQSIATTSSPSFTNLNLSGTLGVSGASSLSSSLTVAGLTTLTNGAAISGTVGINTSGTGATSLGNSSAALQISSTGLNVSTGGVVTGVTGFTQTSGNFTQNGTGSFTTGTGAATIGSLSTGLVLSNATGLLSSGTVDRNNASYFNTALTVANGGTGSTTAAGARTNLGAAASGTNTDITSLGGLTTALSAGQGGTGLNGSTAANGSLLIGNGSGYTLANLTQGSGISITNGAGAITIAVDSTICTTAGNCAGSGGGITGAGTTNTIALFSNTGSIGNSIITQAGTTITVAGTLNATALQGDGSDITNLNASNLASGTVASARISGNYSGITGTGTLTSGSIAAGFGTISTANDITTSAALQGNTLSIGGGTFAVSAAGTIAAATGITSSGAITFSSLNVAGVVKNSATGVLSTGTVALGTETTGNYVATLGTLTGLTTTGNTGAGSTPTISVTYGSGVNTAAQGNTGLSFTGSGNLTGTVSGTAGGGFSSNTLNVVANPTFAGLVTADGGLTVTGANTFTVGTGATSLGGTLAVAGTTTLSGVLNVNAGAGVVADFSGRVSGADAVSADEFATLGQVNSAVGGAAGNYIANGTAAQTANFNITGSGTTGTLNVTANALVGGTLGVTGLTTLNGGTTIAGATSIAGTTTINTTGTATTSIGNATGSLSLTGATTINGSTSISGANTLTTGTGAVTLGSLSTGLVLSNASGLLSSGTIDRNDAAYQNGTLTVANGGTGVNGSTASNGSLLIGNGNGYTLANLTQGSGISITNGAGSISIAVDNTICTTAGNCAGSGTGVTTAGGTTGTISLFTGAQAIGDSIITQAGTTITVAGTLSATALQGDGSAITGLNASNLASGTVASARISGSYSGITGTGILTSGSIASGFGSISTANNITTTAALQGNTLSIGTGAFAVNATGAITAATGISSSGSVVLSSLNAGGVVRSNISGQLTNGTVALGTETTGNYVAALGTLTGLSTTGNTGAGSTPTLSVNYGSTANTAAQGNTAFTFTPASGNLTGSLSGTAGGGFTSTTLSVVSNPTFAGLITADGGISVTGVNTLTVGTGATSLGGALSVAGTTTLSGVLNVGAGTGIVASFSGRVSGGDAVSNNEFTTLSQLNAAIGGAAGSYIANGTAAQTADFNITGSGTTGSLTVSANALIGGTLGVTGLTTLNGGATIAGATSITGTTTVNTTGTASTSLGNTTGSLSLTGNTSINGNTSVTGSNTLTTGTGAVTLGSLGTGLVLSSATGLLTSGTVDRNSATYFSNTLSLANGGTGSTTAAGARTNLGAAASGANSDITSLSAATTVGSTSAALTLQGNASSVFTGTSGGFTTTVGFGAPTADVTYLFQPAATGTYNICTTAGNCAGSGGGVTTAGGTAGRIAKFTGAQSLADSLLSETGTTVTVGGTLAVNTIAPTAAFLLGVSSQNVTVQGAAVAITSTNGAFTNTLNFATPSGSNKTVTIPNASGTVAVSASGPLAIDANGNITCATCTTSGGGGTGAVDSINTVNGAVTLQGTANRISVTTDSGTRTITLSTPQDINTTSSVTFGAVTVTGAVSAGSLSSSGTLSVTGAATAASFNGLNLTANATGFTVAGGTAVRTVDVTANVTLDQNLSTTSTPTFGGLTLSSALTVANGGTGSTTAAGARTNLGAAASGANSDITSLSGLTTALSVGQGGTGATTLTANGILFGNGTAAVQATAAAANSILATNGTNVPGLTQTLPSAVQGNITSTGILTAGSIASGFGTISTANNISTTATIQGGTVTATGVLGGNSLSVNGGTFAVSSAGAITAATGITSSGSITFSSLGAGVVKSSAGGLLSVGSVLLGTDTTGNFVANLGALTGLTTTGNTGAGSTPTLSVTYGSAANTAAQGNVSFTCPSGTGNLSGTGNSITIGAGGTCNSLTVVNNPTFSGLITADGGLTVANNSNFSQTGTGTLSSGTGAVSLNGDVAVAAGKSITLVGGITSTRPASTTTGQLYYDSTTNTMLQYNGSKWVSDRSTSTKIVAASNSSQAVRDSADYVATGTNDQTIINTALTAAAGGSVYLAEGTYNPTAAILIPDNTTLFGAGSATLITIPNAQNGTYNLIQNTNQTTGSGVSVRDILLDGNKAGQTTGSMTGIRFNNMGGGSGSAARNGAKITNVAVRNMYGSHGIYLTNSSNNTLSGNTTQGNGSYGLYIASSSNNTITGNTSQGNSYGIILDSSSSNNTITGNFTQGNQQGIYLSGSSNNTITGNTSQGNSGDGISITSSSNNNTITGNTAQGNARGVSLDGSSNNTITGNTSQGNNNSGVNLNSSSTNIISGNKIHDNSSTNTNNGIFLNAADSNTLTNNDITDTSCITTCFAINISNSTSDLNYLSDNRFSATSGAPAIQDLGTGTVYANQSRAANGGQLTNRTANSTTAFTVQNAAATSLLTVDSTNSKVIAAALDVTNATALGGTLTVGDITTLNGAVSVTGANTLTTGTGAVTLGALGAGIVQSGATGLLSSSAIDRNSATLLSGALSVANGGTGNSTYTNAGVLYYNGTSFVSTAASTGAQCLITTGAGVAPTWGSCTTGTASGVSSLNTFTGSVSIVGTANQVSVNNNANTITLSTPQDINTTSAVTFGRVSVTTATNPGVGTALIFANNTNGTPTGNLADLQTNGTSRFSVGADGNVISTGSVTAVGVNGGAGLIQGTGGLTVGGTVTLNGTQLINAGSTLNTATAITDKATGGSIGTAATTVDSYTTFNINQTTAGQTLTLANPTVTTSGRIVYVNNVGTTQFFLYGVPIGAGKSQQYIWNGTAWTAANFDGAGSAVTNIGTIDGQTKSANGAVISNNTLFLQTADATSVGVVSTGTQTFAGTKTFSGGATINNSLLLLNGTTTTNQRIHVSGTVNSINGSQYGIQNEVTFTPQSGSNQIYGTINIPLVSSSAVNLGDVMSNFSRVDIAASYTGQITNGVTYRAASPVLSGTNPITNFNQFQADGINNGGNTTGTVRNRGVLISGGTSAAAAGGTLINTGLNVALSSGSGAGTTTNYGVYIQGDGGTGGAGTTTNFALYSASNANSYIQGGLEVAGNFTATGSQFTNNGSTLFTVDNITNRATGGAIGTAAATVDVNTTFNVNQTTAGQTLTLPSPTTTTSGRIVYVNNVGTASFTMYGVVIASAKSQQYIWNGTAWTPASIDGAGSGVNTVGTIDGQSKSSDGAVISGNSIFLQTADATSIGLVSTGAQTFAGAKTFTGNANFIGSNAAPRVIINGQDATIALGDGFGGADVYLSRSGTLAALLNSALTIEGNLTVNNNRNITQTGTGTFSTGTGNVSLNGATTVNSTLAFTTLGATNSDAVLCRNGTNQLAACTSTFATTSNLAGYVQLQGVTPGTAQTGNINISGTIIAGTIQGGGLSIAGQTTLNATGTASTTIGNPSSLLSISGNGALATTNVLNVRVAADAFDRLNVQADGTLGFGSGASATDSFIRRTGAGILQLSATNSLSVSLTSGTGHPELSGSGGRVNFGSNVDFRNGSVLRVLDAGNDRSAQLVHNNDGDAVLSTSAGNIIIQPSGGAGTVSLNGDVTVAAGKSISLVGGITSTRPVSPTEGMLYYDTTTKQLLVYANGKWQADRSTATKIIATSAVGGTSGAIASQNPESADFVNTSSTSAQTVINAAIAALPTSGGSVLLREGTYVVSGSINVPDNVTLMGVGNATIIKLQNSHNASVNIISNTNVTNGNINLTVKDLKIDGNKANQTAGTINGLSFRGFSTYVRNATATGVTVTNTRNDGIFLEYIAESKIEGNYVKDATGTGINLRQSASVTVNDNNVIGSGQYGIWTYENYSGVSIAGNTVVGSSSYGLYLRDGRANNISGNLFRLNSVGLYISNTYENNISSNTFTENISHGIELAINGGTNNISSNYIGINGGDGISSSTSVEAPIIASNLIESNAGSGINLDMYGGGTISSNTVTANYQHGIVITDSWDGTISANAVTFNGGTGTFDGIRVVGDSDRNNITGNTIRDNSGSGFAINIQNPSSTSNYLSNNTFSGSALVAGINDLGTGTIYVNQSIGVDGANLVVRTANSTAALSIQNASGTSLLTADTTNSRVNVARGSILSLSGSSTTGYLRYDGTNPVLQLSNLAASGGVQIQSDGFQVQDTVGYNNNLTIDNIGRATFDNRVDSTDAFRVTNAAGTGILTVDTTNGRVGINVTSPSNAVDLAIGDNDTGINQAGDGRLALVTNGSARLSVDDFKTEVSGNLIVGTPVTTVNNTRAVIATGAAGNVGLVVQGAASQTADLLRLNRSDNVTSLGFTANGGIYSTDDTLTLNSVNDNTIRFQTYGDTTFNLTNFISDLNSGLSVNEADSTFNQVFNIQGRNTSSVDLMRVTTGAGVRALTMNSTGKLTLGSPAVLGTERLAVAGGIYAQEYIDVRRSGGAQIFTLDATGSLFNINPSETATTFNNFDSAALRFGSNYYNGTTSVRQQIDLLNKVDNTGNYRLAVLNNSGLETSSINSNGTLTLGKVASSGTVSQGQIVFSDGTTSNFGLTLQSSTLTANRTINFPNSTATTDTVCLQTLSNCNGSGSGVSIVGAFDGGTANANGATITGTSIFLQSASSSFPGLVNTTAQSFAGVKTFNNNVDTLGYYQQNGVTVINTNTGTQNTFVGKQAGNTATTGSQNTALGDEALKANTTGAANTAVGQVALISNTTGGYNVAIGQSTMTNNVAGNFNTAVGQSALQANNGSSNAAFGQAALNANTTGNANTAVGGNALQYATSAGNNTAVGVASLQNTSTGGFNVGLGSAALQANTTGTYNTAIGSNANVGSGSLSNATAIGASALATQSNSLILGSINGVNGATASTSVGIGTTDVSRAKLTVESIDTTSATGRKSGVFNQLTVQPAAAQAAGAERFASYDLAYVPAVAINDIQSLVGNFGESESYGTGNINTMTGVKASAYSGNSTVQWQRGLHAYAGIESGSTVNQAAIYVDNYVSGTGGAVATNTYGIFIANMDNDGVNEYGIFQASDNDKNFFAGDLLVGTTNNNLGDLVVNSGSAGGLGGTISITNDATPTIGNRARLGFDLFHMDDRNNLANIDAVLANASNGATDLRVSLWDGDGDNEVLTLLNNGNVGIGQNTPTNKLAVYEYNPTSGGSKFMTNFYLDNIVTANSNLNSTASYIGNGIQAATGITVSGSQTGVESQMILSGAGTVNSVVAYTGSTYLIDSGVVNSSAVFRAASPGRDTTGTIGTSYGLLIDPQKQSFVTTAYGIYQSGASDYNFFAGNVSIGTGLNSDIKLHVDTDNGENDIALQVDQGDTTTTEAALIIKNAGLGNAVFIGDDGTTTDSTPFVVNDAGRVGIGVGTPIAKLQVVGEVNETTAPAMIIQQATGQSSDLLQIRNSANGTLAKFDQFGNLSAPNVNASQLNSAANALIAQNLGTSPTAVTAIFKLGAGQTGDLFQARNTSDVALVSITSTGLLKVGTTSGPDLGGAALLVTSMQATTALRVGDATNGVDITGTSPVSYRGTARPTKKIRLTAEYAGAVLDAGSGANNAGVMTSGVNVTNRMNYYKWTTTSGTNQNYDVVVQVPIPSDFDGFATTNPIRLDAYTSNTTNGTVSFELRDSTNSVIQNFVSVTPTANTTWQSRDPGTVTGTYTAGDYLTVRIRMQSPNAGDVRIGNLTMDYLSKF